jgi:methyltransferase (TIGR00027 family)
MTEASSSVRNISDTARWVAYFRARESERPDALFRDPYAERLAGERGFHIANTLPEGNKHEWAWVARTYLFDKFVTEQIQNGADLVINLAAGLDARPYRMALPGSLQWLEADFPEIISYKQEMLANEKPKCLLERIALDLSDKPARRELFAELNRRAKKIVVLTEGLLIYFTPQEVGAFASDLASESRFHSWVIDLTSPGQLKLMQRTSGTQLSEAGAAFKFGPPEGANFFVPYGWTPRDVQGLLKTAAHFQRSPKGLIPMNVDSFDGVPPNFPWTGVCLLTRPESSSRS